MKTTNQPTPAALKSLLKGIRAIQTNGTRVLSDGELDRLLGAEQAILLALDQDNHVMTWVAQSAAAIAKLHAQKPESCQCGACKIHRAG